MYHESKELTLRSLLSSLLFDLLPLAILTFPVPASELDHNDEDKEECLISFSVSEVNVTTLNKNSREEHKQNEQLPLLFSCHPNLLLFIRLHNSQGGLSLRAG